MKPTAEVGEEARHADKQTVSIPSKCGAPKVARLLNSLKYRKEAM